MTNARYRRNVDDLRKVASMFWPLELSKKEAELSIVPKLLETQEQFLAILSVPVSDIEKLYKVIQTSALPANLFLKHLVVLSDFGGEMLQRVNNQFSTLFPEKKLHYIKNNKVEKYQFKSLPFKGVLSNDKLGISGKKLLEPKEITDISRDIIALLLYGGMSSNENTAKVLSKCEIGTYLGEPEKLKKFVRQRYILVSRITSGAQSNNLGQIAQDYVKQYIEKELNIPGVKVVRDGHIPEVRHTEDNSNKLTTFDIVVNNGTKYAAVEITFQVTTNSVIERKAGQAQSRYNQIEKMGHKIAYVIDGVGNFQRESAVRTLCSFSHCTVAFSKEELGVLCQFLREYFKE